MNKEVEVGGNTYLVGKLDAFAQFHVARRLAPVITKLGLGLAEFARNGNGVLDEDTLFSALGPVAEVVANMKDEDVDYILQTCLRVAKRRDGERWAIVMQGKQLMYADTDMQTMLRVTVATIQENMGGFFPMLPGAQQ